MSIIFTVYLHGIKQIYSSTHTPTLTEERERKWKKKALADIIWQ
jgi:hypothetical protein